MDWVEIRQVKHNWKMTNFVYIATSLDNFIAKPDGSIDWLTEIPNPDQSDYGYAEFMEKIDAVVMGRITFEKVLTFTEWLYPVPVFVFSHSHLEIPEKLKGKAEFIEGEPLRILGELNAQGYRNLYIDGGKLIQSFLREDLIDEMIITRVPVLLGDGIPLFGKLPASLKFQLIKTETYNSSLIKCHYKRIRE